MIQNAAVIGRGAVGTLFGSIIQAKLGNEHFCFLASEERINHYRQAPFLCNGKPTDFTYVAHPEDFASLDLILIAVKYTNLQEALKLIDPFVGENTIILSLLNGIVSETDCKKALHQGRIVHSIAQLMDSVKTEEGIRYTKEGEIVLGYVDEQEKKAMDEVVSFFNDAKVPYKISQDILHDQWSKLMLNCAINQICAVYDVGYGACSSNGPLQPLFKDVMKEVQSIAKLEGIDLSDAEIEGWVHAVDQLDPDAMPSMRQDRLAKRKSEVMLFSKTIMDLGAKHHVSVPLNSSLYEKIILMEQAY